MIHYLYIYFKKYYFSLVFYGKRFFTQRLLHFLLILLRKIDSSFLEQIFDTEQSDFNENSETINNFFSEMQSHFDNEWAANESTEFRQLKIIFDVCCAISNLKRDQLKKSDACTLLFEKIQLYLELFDTKPFCSNDVYSLMNLIGDRCEPEIFQKVILEGIKR